MLKTLFNNKKISALRNTLVFFIVMLLSTSHSGIIPEPPAIEATAYVLMDAKTGKVIAAYNADQKMPPASLTKMMTSYIATIEIEKGNISETDQVPISVHAWKAEGSRMFVKEGSSVSVLDLLKGVIIQSGNDASIALAEYVAGSEESFANLMNNYAVQLKMENTHFKNATGLPHPEHLTTANDLAKLARAIIYDHPDHYKIYSQKTFTYGGIQQENRNTLIFDEMPVDGLKTGHTEEAGYCLVASAEQNDTRLISVVLGTSSEQARAKESKKLLTHGFRFYETVNLYKASELISEQKLWMGKNPTIQLGLSEDLQLTIARGTKKDLSAKLNVNAYIKAPLKKGAKLGTLTVSIDGQLIAEKDLVALNDENKGSIIKQIMDFIKLFFVSFRG